VIVEVSFKTQNPASAFHLSTSSYFPTQNDEYFKRLPEPSEDELDMLDLAFGLTDT